MPLRVSCPCFCWLVRQRGRFRRLLNPRVLRPSPPCPATPRTPHLPADGSTIAASRVILAVGHSARDLYRSLLQHDVQITPKPFAMGFRQAWTFVLSPDTLRLTI